MDDAALIARPRGRRGPALATVVLCVSLTSPEAARAQGAAGVCARELVWAAAYAARNYAGYADKVTPATRPAYDALLDTLGAAARGAADDAACDAVLARWTAFFRDRHLSAGRRGPGAGGGAEPAEPSADVVRARFAAWPRVAVDEAAARARLAALGTARAPVEGIWESPPYRVAVLRDSLLPTSPLDAAFGGAAAAGAPALAAPSFTMVVLRADSAWWTPDQVKARFSAALLGTVPLGITPLGTDPLGAASGGAGGACQAVYRARFFVRDHTPGADSARVVRNVLVVGSSTRGRRFVWVRRWPVLPGDLDSTALAAAVPGAGFAARELAPGTVLVRVPTFGDTRAMDSLVAAEGDRIRRAERLVIDVRGNGGGADYNYRFFRPLLYTQPVRDVNARVLATDDNVRAWRAVLGEAGMTDAQRAEYRASIDAFERGRVRARAAGQGDWVDRPDETITEPAVLARPRRVAVLVDRGCASSCEQFLLEARQSRKTTLYGEPSGGVLDYANVRSAAAADTSAAAPPVAGSTLVLHYPTTRSKRLPAEPVDNVGIPPAVPVPAEVVLPLEWVRRHLEAAGAAGAAGGQPPTL